MQLFDDVLIFTQHLHNTIQKEPKAFQCKELYELYKSLLSLIKSAGNFANHYLFQKNIDEGVKNLDKATKFYLRSIIELQYHDQFYIPHFFGHDYNILLYFLHSYHTAYYIENKTLLKGALLSTDPINPLQTFNIDVTKETLTLRSHILHTLTFLHTFKNDLKQSICKNCTIYDLFTQTAPH